MFSIYLTQKLANNIELKLGIAGCVSHTIPMKVFSLGFICGVKISLRLLHFVASFKLDITLQTGVFFRSIVVLKPKFDFAHMHRLLACVFSA